MNTEAILFSLLRAEICGEAVTDDVKQALTPEALAGLYKLAARHDLVHIVGQALGNLGLLGSDELSKEYKAATRQVFGKHRHMENTLAGLSRIFEQAQIPFLPLKGSVLRQYYPDAWLRNSSDIDILVKEENLESAARLLEEHDYIRKDELKPYDISFHTPNGIYLELHFALIDDTVSKVQGNMLSQIWEHSTLVAGTKYRYEMPDEWFYFYHMAHMGKHFQSGGCGIRLVLDTWVLNHRVPFDREKRDVLLKKGGLLKFESAVNALAAVWFDGAAADPLSEQLARFILDSGLHGTVSNKTVAEQVKTGGKEQYVRSRFVIDYDELKYMFPVLKKHRWLTPVFQMVRWLRLLLVVGIRRCIEKLRNHGSVSSEAYTQTERLLDQVGLLERPTELT